MAQESFDQGSNSPSPGKMTFSVRPTALKVFGWIGISLFGALAVGSLVSGEFGVTPIFLLFAAVGAFLVLTTGELSMNSETVTYNTPLGKYQMKWDEVKQIEMDFQRYAVVFYSQNRNERLAVAGPAYWSGSDNGDMEQLLSQEVQKRQIPIKQSMRAPYTMSRNTKVS
jgi:hypothetical protein